MQSKNMLRPNTMPVNNREELSSTDRSNQQYNYQFYEEYKKLFDTTTSLSSQMKTLVKRKQEAWQNLSRLEKRAQQFRDDIRGQPPERKKRSRRTADQIERQFRCEEQKCNRSYGTQGSLFQHVKLKHPLIYEELKKKKSFSEKSFDEVAEQSSQNQQKDQE